MPWPLLIVIKQALDLKSAEIVKLLILEYFLRIVPAVKAYTYEYSLMNAAAVVQVEEYDVIFQIERALLATSRYLVRRYRNQSLLSVVS